MKLAYTGGREESYLISNEVGMEQELHHRVRDFSNTLNYTPALKNGHIINLSWYLNHYNSPQKLSIQPGINKDILNKGDEYAGLGQSAGLNYMSKSRVLFSIHRYVPSS